MSTFIAPDGKEFETWVEVSPSRDWRKSDDARNYGISTCRIWFYLKGPKGAVQFQIGTEWAIKPVRAHLARFPSRDVDEYRKPSGWDLGYHSREPRYDGQEPMGHDCDVIGGRCFYDGSSLNADAVVEGFLAGGTKWLWSKLAEYYSATFEDGPWPDFTARYLPHPDDDKGEAA